MELLIACLVAFYVVKNGVVDTAYAVRGKPSPRQQLTHKLIDRRSGRQSRDSAVGRYVRQLWQDSWDDALNRHTRQRDRRARRRLERESGQASSGAARRFFGGIKQDLWSHWDRAWDNANVKRHDRRLAGQAERAAAAIIAAADAQRNQPADDLPPTRRPQDSAGTTDGTASPEGPAIAIADQDVSSREESAMTTTSGETTSLSQTLSAIQAWENSTQEAITSLETSIASLQGAEVGASVTGPLATAQEAFGQALAAFGSARTGLNASVQIGDMYQSSPDAGSKEYVSG